MAGGHRRSLGEAIGAQLRHPSGRLGHVVGHLMAYLNRQPNRLAIEALDIRPNDSILELGSGPGKAIAELVVRAPLGRIIGIDLSSLMLDMAERRNHAAVRRGQVILSMASLAALPLGADSVDRILAVNVVYFVPGTPGALHEARRVLKPGGRMVVYATDRASMQRWAFAGSGTHRLFNADQLVALLRETFVDDRILIQQVDLVFGITGLIATVDKSRSPT